MKPSSAHLFLLLLLWNALLCAQSPFDDFNFQPNTYEVISYVDQGKFEAADSLLQFMDSKTLESDKPLLAEYNFVKAYYTMFHKGELESFGGFTRSATLYDSLQMIRHRNLAEVYIIVDLYISARYNLVRDRGQELLKKLSSDDEEAKAHLHNILGASYSGHDMDYERAQFHIQKAIDFFLNQNYNRRLISLYGLKAACHNNMGNFDRAIEYIDSAAYFAREIKHEKQLAFLNIRKHRALFNAKRYDESFAAMRQAEDYFVKHPTEQGQLDWIYVSAAEKYAALNNFEQAYAYSLKGARLSTSMRTKANDERMNELMVTYETEKKERLLEIQQLNLALQDQKIKNITIYGLLGVGILSLGFLLFYNRYKNRQKEKFRLKEKAHQQSILQTTIQTQEAERKRIARDLHDGIGQQLSGLKMGLEQYYKKLAVPNGLSKHIAQLDEASQEVRAISHQMMPKALQELGLASAVSDMLDKSFAGTSIHYVFESMGMEKRMDESIEIGCYRILQELINNIIKHSSATELDVQLIKNKNSFRMLVEENGTGYNPLDNDEIGHGISNMLTRAQVIKGNLNFERKGNSGMLTTLSVPLQNTVNV